MKLINNNLRDKWIQDSGATSHMTGNPEFQDEQMPRSINLLVSWQ
jgi:hypothetical protein